jgi:UDP-2,3-diacylglucosamine pyrophosphatase LpxH
MSSVTSGKVYRYRSVWISDVHLGFPGCNAEFLLDFLRSTQCEYLYLVGDIVDVWYMKKRLFWPQSHNDVIRTLLGKAKHGTKVFYVPGNHDELFRDYDGMSFGNVSICNQVIHTTANGRRLLVLHGDQFDAVVKFSKTLALLGTKVYDWLLSLNGIVNRVRRKLGFRYWSLSAFLKHRVKNAVHYISSFETAVAYEAQTQSVDGLVCGHIHKAEMSEISGVLYCNTGDWVESCTALVEQKDGSLQLLHWSDAQHTVKEVGANMLQAA